jgi:hypothetical protein
MGPAELADVLRDRNLAFRTRIVQIMVLGALVLQPVPESVAERVAEYARALETDDDMIEVARAYAHGDRGLAAIDFQRNGYTESWSETAAERLHTSHALADAWAEVEDDPELRARWQALEALPPGTLGHCITEFYRARGFSYPGAPGSAPPRLAQHDWVHVLADYGTTVEAELEVFGFIARANDDPRGFSLLAMVVALFETGSLEHAVGIFDADPGHLDTAETALRLADAMRRGAMCTGSIDFLDVDWFEHAHLPVAEVRAFFGVGPKGESVAGISPGPWDPGGISPFQYAAGQALARAEAREYDAFGATP